MRAVPPVRPSLRQSIVQQSILILAAAALAVGTAAPASAIIDYRDGMGLMEHSEGDDHFHHEWEEQDLEGVVVFGNSPRNTLIENYFHYLDQSLVPEPTQFSMSAQGRASVWDDDFESESARASQEIRFAVPADMGFSLQLTTDTKNEGIVSIALREGLSNPIPVYEGTWTDSAGESVTIQGILKGLTNYRLEVSVRAHASPSDLGRNDEYYDESAEYALSFSVPEAGTGSLLGVALLGLCGRRRARPANPA